MAERLRECLIVGSGVGGLSLGALLAGVGVRVTVLEAHPSLIGGHAHTLEGHGYRYSAGPRYLWNFEAGRIGHRFLAKCGLLDRLPFVNLDREGFDHVYIGDEEPVLVPNGWDRYEDLLQERFPHEARAIARFFGLCREVFRVLEYMDERGLQFDSWGDVFCSHLLTLRLSPIAAARFLTRARWTLQDAFDASKLSPRLQAILYAHGMIFAESPSSISFLAYAGGTLFYHRGCSYPVDGMAGFVGELSMRIRRGGGEIITGAKVVRAEADRTRGVRHVRTTSGDQYSADVVVSDIDPLSFLALIEMHDGSAAPTIPSYRYGPGLTSLYLGVRDAAVLRRHFGRWNIWYRAPLDPKKQSQLGGPTALYLNSPTLLTGNPDDAPPGGATVTAFTNSPLPVRRSPDHDAGRPCGQPGYEIKPLLEFIDRRFASGISGCLDAVMVRTPGDTETILRSPGGNSYGRALTPDQVMRKIPWRGLLPNLYLVGAYIGFPGISTVVHSACRVYEELTGDRV
jgi:all-trans-retinol 13,14-reductase